MVALIFKRGLNGIVEEELTADEFLYLNKLLFCDETPEYSISIAPPCHCPCPDLLNRRRPQGRGIEYAWVLFYPTTRELLIGTGRKHRTSDRGIDSETSEH